MDEQYLREFPPEAVESDADYSGVALRDCELIQSGLGGISLESSLLAKVRASGISIPGFALADTVARDCDFSNAVWEKARLTGSHLATCRLTGWNIVDGLLRNVRLTGCKINLGVFHNVTLIDCQFQGCDLREADFQRARLKNVAFRGCDLRSARFAAASLQEVDFRGSHLAGISFDAGSLAGNTFDPSQLLDVVRILGLVVEEIEDTDHRPRL